MRVRIAWGLLATASALLAWASWTTPPRPDPPTPPLPLARRPTPEELDQVRAQLQTLRAELDQAQAALGRPVAAHELEGPLPIPAGRALPSGLPDNPLRPSVSAVVERCPPEEQPGDEVDWLYCAELGRIEAVGLAAYQDRGSE
ncbi:hypothetical protein L6R53_21360 [Myxococcota bacterium]|nr:hypothetical protein [Myxococcota bacterium]